MTKVRALSANAIELGRSRNRKREWPVIGTIYHYFTKFSGWVLHYFRRRKNVVRMKALKRAQWYDCDTRLFEAGFQILVDYVEGELSWMQLITDGKVRWYSRWFPVPNARERGLKLLEWEIQLGDDSISQSKAAKEIRDLYLWYKDVRPTRIDPFSEVPDRPLIFESDNLTFDENGQLESDEEYSKAVMDAFRKQEKQEEEDTGQLVRLMKIRRSMWT